MRRQRKRQKLGESNECTRRFIDLLTQAEDTVLSDKLYVSPSWMYTASLWIAVYKELTQAGLAFKLIAVAYRMVPLEVGKSAVRPRHQFAHGKKLTSVGAKDHESDGRGKPETPTTLLWETGATKPH